MDLTAEAFGRTKEVESWIDDAKTIAAKRNEPDIRTGSHCSDPFDCNFLTYCTAQEPQPTFPAAWLPRKTKAIKILMQESGVIEMGEIPDTILNPRQLRVKTHTLAQSVFLNAKGAAEALAYHGFPAYFLDFETISFGVPIWRGTKPYQQNSFPVQLAQAI